MTENEEKTPQQLTDEMEQAQHPISDNDVNAAFQASSTEGSSDSGGSSNVIPIAVIIAAAVVMLGCILACAAVAAVFLYNAPW